MDPHVRDRELRMAGVDLGRDNLEHYWTVDPEGLKRWRFHEHPWETLRRLLAEHPGIHDPSGLASTYFRKTFGYWPGDRKGNNPVGPG